MIKLLKWLSVLSTIGMLFVLLGGALVTKTDSGLGCGQSWPLCEGEFFPSKITPELVIELSHRLVTGTVGILVLALSILSWKYFGHVRETKFLAFVSILFLVLQSLIGASNVLWPQSDFALAMHFGISLISFASVFLLTLLIFEIDKKFDANSLIIDKKLRRQFYLLTIYTLVVVYTGALVRHAHASLVCKDWPLCDPSLPISNFTFQHWVQMSHRFAAGLLIIWVIYLYIRIRRQYKNSKIMQYGWTINLLFIILQATLGAFIIFTMLNLYIALFHALIICCFFALLTYFVLLSTRSSKFDKSK